MDDPLQARPPLSPPPLQGSAGVSYQESPTRPDELTDAIDRALMAGLRLLQPREDAECYDLICQVCPATLTVPMRPLSPDLAAWRLDAFTVRHISHEVPPPDGPVCRMCGVEGPLLGPLPRVSEGAPMGGVKPQVSDTADTILTPRGRGSAVVDVDLEPGSDYDPDGGSGS